MRGLGSLLQLGGRDIRNSNGSKKNRQQLPEKERTGGEARPTNHLINSRPTVGSGSSEGEGSGRAQCPICRQDLGSGDNAAINSHIGKQPPCFLVFLTAGPRVPAAASGVHARLPTCCRRLSLQGLPQEAPQSSDAPAVCILLQAVCCGTGGRCPARCLGASQEAQSWRCSWRSCAVCHICSGH